MDPLCEQDEELMEDVFALPNSFQLNKRFSPRSASSTPRYRATKESHANIDESSVDIYGDLSMDSIHFDTSNTALHTTVPESFIKDDDAAKDVDLFTDVLISDLSEKSQMQKKVKALEEKNKILISQSEALQKSKEHLTKNISCLFLTARKEIQLREEEISKLKMIVQDLRNTNAKLNSQSELLQPPESSDFVDLNDLKGQTLTKDESKQHNSRSAMGSNARLSDDSKTRRTSSHSSCNSSLSSSRNQSWEWDGTLREAIINSKCKSLSSVTSPRLERETRSNKNRRKSDCIRVKDDNLDERWKEKGRHDTESSYQSKEESKNGNKRYLSAKDKEDKLRSPQKGLKRKVRSSDRSRESVLNKTERLCSKNEDGYVFVGNMRDSVMQTRHEKVIDRGKRNFGKMTKQGDPENSPYEQMFEKNYRSTSLINQKHFESKKSRSDKEIISSNLDSRQRKEDECNNRKNEPEERGKKALANASENEFVLTKDINIDFQGKERIVKEKDVLKISEEIAREKTADHLGANSVPKMEDKICAADHIKSNDRTDKERKVGWTNGLNCQGKDGTFKTRQENIYHREEKNKDNIKAEIKAKEPDIAENGSFQNCETHFEIEILSGDLPKVLENNVISKTQESRTLGGLKERKLDTLMDSTYKVLENDSICVEDSCHMGTKMSELTNTVERKINEKVIEANKSQLSDAPFGKTTNLKIPLVVSEDTSSDITHISNSRLLETGLKASDCFTSYISSHFSSQHSYTKSIPFPSQDSTQNCDNTSKQYWSLETSSSDHPSLPLQEDLESKPLKVTDQCQSMSPSNHTWPFKVTSHNCLNQNDNQSESSSIPLSSVPSHSNDHGEKPVNSGEIKKNATMITRAFPVTDFQGELAFSNTDLLASVEKSHKGDISPATLKNVPIGEDSISVSDQLNGGSLGCGGHKSNQENKVDSSSPDNEYIKFEGSDNQYNASIDNANITPPKISKTSFETDSSYDGSSSLPTSSDRSTNIMCTPNLIVLGDEETSTGMLVSPCKSRTVPSELYPPGVRMHPPEVSTHRHIRGEPEVLHSVAVSRSSLRKTSGSRKKPNPVRECLVKQKSWKEALSENGKDAAQSEGAMSAVVQTFFKAIFKTNLEAFKDEMAEKAAVDNQRLRAALTQSIVDMKLESIQKAKTKNDKGFTFHQTSGKITEDEAMMFGKNDFNLVEGNRSQEGKCLKRRKTDILPDDCAHLISPNPKQHSNSGCTSLSESKGKTYVCKPIKEDLTRRVSLRTVFINPSHTQSNSKYCNPESPPGAHSLSSDVCTVTSSDYFHRRGTNQSISSLSQVEAQEPDSTSDPFLPEDSNYHIFGKEHVNVSSHSIVLPPGLSIKCVPEMALKARDVFDVHDSPAKCENKMLIMRKPENLNFSQGECFKAKSPVPSGFRGSLSSCYNGLFFNKEIENSATNSSRKRHKKTVIKSLSHRLVEQNHEEDDKDSAGISSENNLIQHGRDHFSNQLESDSTINGSCHRSGIESTRGPFLEETNVVCRPSNFVLDELSLESTSLSEFDHDIVRTEPNFSHRATMRSMSFSPQFSVGHDSPMSAASSQILTPSRCDPSPVKTLTSGLRAQDTAEKVDGDSDKETYSEEDDTCHNQDYPSNVTSKTTHEHKLSRHMSFQELQRLKLAKKYFPFKMAVSGKDLCVPDEGDYDIETACSDYKHLDSTENSHPLRGLPALPGGRLATSKEDSVKIISMCSISSLKDTPQVNEEESEKSVPLLYPQYHGEMCDVNKELPSAKVHKNLNDDKLASQTFVMLDKDTYIDLVHKRPGKVQGVNESSTFNVSSHSQHGYKSSRKAVRIVQLLPQEVIKAGSPTQSDRSLLKKLISPNEFANKVTKPSLSGKKSSPLSLNDKSTNVGIKKRGQKASQRESKYPSSSQSQMNVKSNGDLVKKPHIHKHNEKGEVVSSSTPNSHQDCDGVKQLSVARNYCEVYKSSTTTNKSEYYNDEEIEEGEICDDFENGEPQHISNENCTYNYRNHVSHPSKRVSCVRSSELSSKRPGKEMAYGTKRSRSRSPSDETVSLNTRSGKRAQSDCRSNLSWSPDLRKRISDRWKRTDGTDRNTYHGYGWERGELYERLGRERKSPESKKSHHRKDDAFSRKHKGYRHYTPTKSSRRGMAVMRKC